MAQGQITLEEYEQVRSKVAEQRRLARMAKEALDERRLTKPEVFDTVESLMERLARRNA